MAAGVSPLDAAHALRTILAGTVKVSGLFTKQVAAFLLSVAGIIIFTGTQCTLASEKIKGEHCLVS